MGNNPGCCGQGSATHSPPHAHTHKLHYTCTNSTFTFPLDCALHLCLPAAVLLTWVREWWKLAGGKARQ